MVFNILPESLNNLHCLLPELNTIEKIPGISFNSITFFYSREHKFSDCMLFLHKTFFIHFLLSDFLNNSMIVFLIVFIGWSIFKAINGTSSFKSVQENALFMAVALFLLNAFCSIFIPPYEIHSEQCGVTVNFSYCFPFYVCSSINGAIFFIQLIIQGLMFRIFTFQRYGFFYSGLSFYLNLCISSSLSVFRSIFTIFDQLWCFTFELDIIVCTILIFLLKTIVLALKFIFANKQT